MKGTNKDKMVQVEPIITQGNKSTKDYLTLKQAEFYQQRSVQRAINAYYFLGKGR